MAGEDIEYAEDVLEDEEAEGVGQGGVSEQDKGVGMRQSEGAVAASGNGKRRLTPEELAMMQDMELQQKIPGYRSLFRVPNEYLHEACRLPNDLTAFAFAVRDMQQAVLNISGENARTLSAWDVLKYRYMGYTFSVGGQARTELVTLYNLTAEMKEAAIRGGLLEEGGH